MRRTDSSVCGCLLRCSHCGASTHSFKFTCQDYTVTNIVCCHIHAVSLKEPEDEKNPPMADDMVDDVMQKRESLENLIQREQYLKDEKDLEHLTVRTLEPWMLWLYFHFICTFFSELANHRCELTQWPRPFSWLFSTLFCHDFKQRERHFSNFFPIFINHGSASLY